MFWTPASSISLRNPKAKGLHCAHSFRNLFRCSAHTKPQINGIPTSAYSHAFPALSTLLAASGHSVWESLELNSSEWLQDIWLKHSTQCYSLGVKCTPQTHGHGWQPWWELLDSWARRLICGGRSLQGGPLRATAWPYVQPARAWVLCFLQTSVLTNALYPLQPADWNGLAAMSSSPRWTIATYIPWAKIDPFSFVFVGNLVTMLRTLSHTNSIT